MTTPEGGRARRPSMTPRLDRLAQAGGEDPFSIAECRQALATADGAARLGGPVLAAAGRERPLLRPEPGGDGAAPVLHIDPRFLGGARRP